MARGMGGHLRPGGPWAGVERPAPSRTVKSAERTLALFELFSLHQRPLAVGEISRALGAPQPSMSMLVRNLTHLGYLERDPSTRLYVPTIRIMLLGSWISRRFSDEGNVEQHLEALMRKVGESVFLAIQTGVYSQYVLVQLAAHPHRLEVQSGLLRPIVTTASGRMLLSLKPEDEAMKLVRACNAQISNPRLRVDPVPFMDLLAQIRAQGYARTTGDLTPGQGGIAIATPPPVGKTPLAVGVGGSVERIDAKAEEIVAALREFRAALHPSPPGARR